MYDWPMACLSIRCLIWSHKCELLHLDLLGQSKKNSKVNLPASLTSHWLLKAAITFATSLCCFLISYKRLPLHILLKGFTGPY
jgi:hypothetical protein